MKRNIAVAAVACLAAAGALTGCGGSKSTASSATTSTASAPSATSPAPSAAGGPLDTLTAQQISDRAVAAEKKLTAVHVFGRTVDGAKPMQMDLRLSSDGACIASMTNSGAAIHVIGTPHSTYLKGNNAYWAQAGQSAAGAALHGRWLHTPQVASASPELKDICGLSGFLGSITKDDGGAKTKGQPTEVAGQRTIPITEKTQDGATTVYVADSAQHPYVLKAVQTGSEADSLSFNDFNRPVHPVAPPADQTVSHMNLRR